MTCHSVNPNNPYEIYKLPHISPRFRTKCYYLPVVLNKQRILYKNQLLTISRKKEREPSSFLALGLLSKGGLICRIPTSIYTLRFKNTSACTCIHSNFKAISCVKRGLMKQTLSLCCVCLQTRVLCSGGKFC